jgi:hypothetical protein
MRIKEGWEGIVLAVAMLPPKGKAILGRLTAGAPEGSARATPLGALVEHVKDCRSSGDVRARCSALGD